MGKSRFVEMMSFEANRMYVTDNWYDWGRSQRCSSLEAR